MTDDTTSVAKNEPWRMDYQPGAVAAYIRNADAMYVAEVYVWAGEEAACLANARLIAAAPDLLAALKRVVAIADRQTVEFDEARAAIALAEGTP